MTRAELLKKQISEQQSKGAIVDKIHIIANGTGYSYESIFGKYLDENVKEICLEEPYLRDYYQVNYDYDLNKTPFAFIPTHLLQYLLNETEMNVEKDFFLILSSIALNYFLYFFFFL